MNKDKLMNEFWRMIDSLDRQLTATGNYGDGPIFADHDDYIVSSWKDFALFIVHINERVGGNYVDEFVRTPNGVWKSIEGGPKMVPNGADWTLQL